MRGGGVPGLPYHRVIAAEGRLGGYGGNETLKAALLRGEGLVVSGGRVRRFPDVRWPVEWTVNLVAGLVDSRVARSGRARATPAADAAV